mmetsp:Transcript_170325/g.540927  ORF Transcript_170325/g.540927 Transcript_170325/m.540927 type:complete len:228 (+) Transcript_170325:126-809(+)
MLTSRVSETLMTFRGCLRWRPEGCGPGGCLDKCADAVDELSPGVVGAGGAEGQTQPGLPEVGQASDHQGRRHLQRNGRGPRPVDGHGDAHVRLRPRVRCQLAAEPRPEDCRKECGDRGLGLHHAALGLRQLHAECGGAIANASAGDADAVTGYGGYGGDGGRLRGRASARWHNEPRHERQQWWGRDGDVEGVHVVATRGDRLGASESGFADGRGADAGIALCAGDDA